jgi:hypothetical protein
MDVDNEKEMDHASLLLSAKHTGYVDQSFNMPTRMLYDSEDIAEGTRRGMRTVEQLPAE